MSRSLSTYTIKIGGEVLSDEFGIQSLVVTKEVGKIPTARLVIADGDVAKQEFKASNQAYFIPGNEIEIWLGYDSEETSVFKGIITKHRLSIEAKGDDFLYVECKDIAVKTSVGKKSKYFYNLTDQEVMEEILGDYSIENEVESTDVQYEELVQYYCTDWDFILLSLIHI